ncbi:MAG TPA: hypothetical protein VF458_15640 [Ktedonobacteraceae bacterium]
MSLADPGGGGDDGLFLAADRSLRARGLVGLLDRERRSIDPRVAGLLRAYAQPQPALFLDCYRQDWGKGQWLYVFNEQVIFEQSEPEPGVLQFVVLANQSAFQERLRQVLYGFQSEEESTLAGGRVARHLLEEGTSLAQHDPERASQFFNELPESTASALAAALHATRVMYYLARWSALDARVESALTILLGAGHQFLLTLPAADAEHLQVTTASAEQIWSAVAALRPLRLI